MELCCQITPAPPVIASWAGANCRSGRRGLPTGFVLLLALAVFFAWLAVSITGFFRLSPEGAALSRGVMTAAPGVWHKKIAVRVGWATTALVRNATRAFSIPPEGRAALDSVHGGEVGVYTLEQEAVSGTLNSVLSAADRVMNSRGWDRIVGVVSERGMVAVYFPRKPSIFGTAHACVAVLERRQLVVASVSGNLEPMVRFALDRARHSGTSGFSNPHHNSRTL